MPPALLPSRRIIPSPLRPVASKDLPAHEQLYQHVHRAQSTSAIHLRAPKAHDSHHELWGRSISPGATFLGTRQCYNDPFIP
jgi:hypothetical protein